MGINNKSSCLIFNWIYFKEATQKNKNLESNNI